MRLRVSSGIMRIFERKNVPSWIINAFWSPDTGWRRTDTGGPRLRGAYLRHSLTSTRGSDCRIHFTVPRYFHDAGTDGHSILGLYNPFSGSYGRSGSRNRNRKNKVSESGSIRNWFREGRTGVLFPHR